jgi:hypothetical protein
VYELVNVSPRETRFCTINCKLLVTRQRVWIAWRCRTSGHVGVVLKGLPRAAEAAYLKAEVGDLDQPPRAML